MILIDVDPSFGTKPSDFLPEAQRILERVGVKWPNTIAQRGFNDTKHALNIGGYSTVFVDHRGIVRGVGLHGAELEALVDAAMKEWAEERAIPGKEPPGKKRQ